MFSRREEFRFTAHRHPIGPPLLQHTGDVDDDDFAIRRNLFSVGIEPGAFIAEAPLLALDDSNEITFGRPIVVVEAVDAGIICFQFITHTLRSYNFPDRWIRYTF